MSWVFGYMVLILKMVFVLISHSKYAMSTEMNGRCLQSYRQDTHGIGCIQTNAGCCAVSWLQ